MERKRKKKPSAKRKPGKKKREETGATRALPSFRAFYFRVRSPFPHYPRAWNRLLRSTHASERASERAEMPKATQNRQQHRLNFYKINPDTPFKDGHSPKRVITVIPTKFFLLRYFRMRRNACILYLATPGS